MIHRRARFLTLPLAALSATVILALDPTGEPPEPGAGDGQPASGAPSPARQVATAPSPELSAWIELCLRHLTSTDEGVKNGAALALRVAGAAARPALEQAAAGSDPGLSAAAQQILARLSSPPARTREEGYRDTSHRREQAQERLIDSLGPREDQRPKLEAIFGEQERSRADLVRKIRDGELDRTAVPEALEALRRETEEKLAAVLDEAQMESYRQLTRPAGRS